MIKISFDIFSIPVVDVEEKKTRQRLHANVYSLINPRFEEQYNAKKLGNWEYPKWYPERPRQRTKSTKFIAKDNGHLLEGVKKENPWGNYLGTWDLPRRITRDFAEKLAAPPEKLTSRWQKKKDSFLSEKTKDNADEQLMNEEENGLYSKKDTIYTEDMVPKEEKDENQPSEIKSDEFITSGEP